MANSFLLMPSGAALIATDRYPDGWFVSAQLSPTRDGVELKSVEEGGSVLLPLDLADHLVRTNTIVYLYYSDGTPLLIYDSYIEIDRDQLIETIGGSKVLAQFDK